MTMFSPENVYANVCNSCNLDHCLAIPIGRDSLPEGIPWIGGEEG